MKGIAFAAALMLLGSAMVFGEPTELSLEAIILRVQDHERVMQAQITLEQRRATLAAESSWKGAQLTIAPDIGYNDASGEIQLAETALGLDVLFPLGLSQMDQERQVQARELAAIAALELEDARGKAYAELFGLYATSYAAQEYRVVVDKEAELARLRLESIRQKTARGLASLSEQADAEAEYQAASETVIQARLDARLAWFALASAAGLETNRPGSGTPAVDHPAGVEAVIFDLPRFKTPELDSVLKTAPQPGVLMAIAKEQSPDFKSQEQKLAAARRSLESHSSIDLNFSPKLAYATPSTSASLGYGTASGALAVGAGWSPYTSPDTVSAKTIPDNSFTLSIGISGNIDPGGAAQKKALLETVHLEERRLVALDQGIELASRSNYAAYLKAKDSLASAERARRQAEEISAVTQARRTLGQLSPEDEAADEVLLSRAAFSLGKAKIALGQAYLGMISAANAFEFVGLSINGVKP